MMIPRVVLMVALSLGVLSSTHMLVYSEICISENKTFTVKVNLHASELGYYAFEECGHLVNPSIGMEVGETYTFIQTDRSNYFHPLGFAYFPDGAHDGVDELEPGIALGNNTACQEFKTCPAPMYFLNDKYLGNYSNIEDIAPVSSGEENFGLDDYEPLFFHPLPQWLEYGDFSIKLRFDDESYTKDLFYFCHIHQYMSGRIKLLKDGEPISVEDDPPLGYEYDEVSYFDGMCGTYGLDGFQLPNYICPEAFVCDPSPQNQPFASCIDAMNCHMFSGMTTKVSSESNVALFIHQMIPHHQNAVNMAKTLLITNDVNCEDLLDEDDALCRMQTILREIINGQNVQIQAMRGILKDLDLPPTDDCAISAIAVGREDDNGMILAEDLFYSQDEDVDPLAEEKDGGLRRKKN